MTLSPESARVIRGNGTTELPMASLIAPSAGDTAFSEQLAQSHQDGIARGRLEVERAHGVAVASALTALDNVTSDFDRANADWFDRVTEQALDLAVEIAEAIMMREIALSTDPGLDAVRRCLAELRPTESAAIHLNPGDLATLDASDPDLSGRDLRLVADPEVAPGDAIAHVDGGTIDASLRSALQRVVEVVRSC